jgi:hypothetical protein
MSDHDWQPVIITSHVEVFECTRCKRSFSAAILGTDVISDNTPQPCKPKH